MDFGEVIYLTRGRKAPFSHPSFNTQRRRNGFDGLKLHCMHIPCCYCLVVILDFWKKVCALGKSEILPILNHRMGDLFYVEFVLSTEAYREFCFAL